MNKCSGLDRPGCRYLPNADFSNCTSSCRTCLGQSFTEMKTRCVTSLVGPCVSTSWLARQGLSQQVIHNGGHAPVICIPGLPCGTHGHLLRVCNAERTSCKLVSYADVRKQRDDCSISVMPVSQLSHSYDWSLFRTTWPSSDDTIELTSLSQNRGAREFSLSNVVARITDLLNRNGYGHVCNAIARIPHSIRKLHYRFQASETR